MKPATTATQDWEFKARFRRQAFGWRSGPAITRVRQAVAEIKKVAKTRPIVAAEGAVIFLERVSPALEQVDSSSGAIGAAVSNAILELVPLVSQAPAEAAMRAAWLERLFSAHENDAIPYIDQLADHWGELCGSPEVASTWADRLLESTRTSLVPANRGCGRFRGIVACLSALFRAGRFAELIDLLRVDTFWADKQWAVRAIAAQGRLDEALRYADSCRGRWAGDFEIDPVCEELLLAAGRVDEAYARWGVRAPQGGTYLAAFRTVARKYPHKAAREILADLVKTTPGEDGKWFATAKEVGLHAEALALARRSPCDPKTLTRAARDYEEPEPGFALGAGLLALQGMMRGHGYEISGLDVMGAYYATMKAAERLGRTAAVKEEIRRLVAAGGLGAGFVTQLLARELKT